MHWLVEVSRVGESVASERYCIDARRWQSALQEARRLRGDSGPLPNLTIELTDSGYRAIDPKLRVRYVVTEAPPGMPLTDGARAVLSTAPPPVAESVGAAPSFRPAPIPVAPPAASEPVHAAAPPAPSEPAIGAPPASQPRAPAAVSATSGAPAEVAPVAAQAAAAADAAIAQRLSSSVPPGTAPRPTSSQPATLLAAQVIRQREERPSEANPIAYREVAYAVKPGASRADIEALLVTKLDEMRASLSEETRRYVQLAVFDHVFVKRPVRPPLATLQWKDWRGEPVLSFPGFGESSDVPPPSSISTQRMPSWARGMMTSVAPPAAASDLPPVATSAVPRPVSRPPEVDPPPPGLVPAPRPVVQSTPPTLVSATEEPRRPSVIPARVVSIGPSTPSSRPSSPPTSSRSPFATTQVLGSVPAPVFPAGFSAQPAAPVVSTTPPVAPAPEPLVAIAPPEPPPSEPPPSEPPPSSGPDIPIVIEADESPGTPRTESDTTALVAAEAARVAEAVRLNSAPPRESAPPAAPRRSEPPVHRGSDPSMRRRSDPGVARRRGPGEDLIGDLFERMHELSFMPDIVSGADFVASVLGELIPCEATIVHVFDLNRREFVVVRARGPHPNAALMFRTPDMDPFVIEVFRRPSMLSNGAAPKHSRAFGPLGVDPVQVLARGARQGGRYLGLIELGNPQGGAPFHDGEVNALEYVCAQFADFVASRPVVLDEEVVRG
jgi:hypothetical protein